MLAKVFGVICAVSVIWGLVTGRAPALSGAVIDGVSSAVTLTLTLGGMMCFWCGVMEVMRRAGAVRLLSRLLFPLTRRLFPDAAATGCGIDEITANIAANMIGIGNAATPLALEAMKKLDARAAARGLPRGRASDDMVTLTVLNTCSVSLVPMTVASLRRAAGAADPFRIVPAVWICSAVCAAVGVLLARAGSNDAGASSSRVKEKSDGKVKDKHKLKDKADCKGREGKRKPGCYTVCSSGTGEKNGIKGMNIRNKGNGKSRGKVRSGGGRDEVA